MSRLSSSRDADDPLREARERTLGTVLHNSGDPQPVGVAVQHLYLSTVNHGPVDHDHARKARDAALENGLLVGYEDAAGTERYGLTADGVAAIDHAEMPIFDAADEDALREVLEVETSRPDPDKDVIGWANTHLLSLPEDTDA